MLKCVNWDKAISKHDMAFDFGVNVYILGIVYSFVIFQPTHSSQTQHLQDMLATRCRVQNDRANWEKHLRLLSESDIYIIFFNETSDFRAPTAFSFCLSSQFTLQAVCLLYVQHIQYIEYISHFFELFSYISYFLSLFFTISHCFLLFR